MNRRSTGTQYENLAADFLERGGMQILERNFRSRNGEIDLIARDGGTIVFVEVKYRKNKSAGLPEDAVTPRKRRTICRVADYYRMRKGMPEDVPIRFDVIAVEGTALRHYRNAFPYC